MEEQVEMFPEALELKEKQNENNKKDLINPYTGEVFHNRSQTVVGGYCDNSINTKPSMTDSSDYEDINDTIARCGRHRLIEALEAKEAEFAKDGGINSSFDDFDETERSDYDFSEAKQTLNEFEEKLKSASQVSNSSKPASNEDKQSASEARAGSANSSEQAD